MIVLPYGPYLNRPGTTGVRCELVKGGNIVARPQLADWSVTVAAGAARSLTASIIGFNNLVPDEAVIGSTRRYDTGTYGEGRYGDETRSVMRGLLLVGATQVRVWWTFTTGGVTYEEPVGVFDVSADNFLIAEDQSETITLTGYDARRRIDKAGWDGPYKVSAGNAWDMAVNIALDAVPGLTFDTAAQIGFTKNTARRWFGVGAKANLTRWQAIVKLAQLDGFTPYIDGAGKLTAVDVPALASNPSPDWTFGTDGYDNLFTFGQGHDDENLYNTVVVTGSSTKKGVIWAKSENNTAGDPHRIGAIGHRTLEVNASGIETTTDAQALADKLLRKNRGLTERFTFEGLLVPGLPEYAVVRLVSPELNTNDLALLGGYEIHGRQEAWTTYDAVRRVS